MLRCHAAVSRACRSAHGALLLALLGLSVTASLGCGKNSPATGTASDSGAEAGPPPPAGNLSCDSDASDWPMFGQNVCNTNSQATAGGISTATVGTLGVKWVAQLGASVSATPTVVNGSVYVPDWGGNINRLDATTGAVTWSKSVGAILKGAGDAGASLPGFASRTAPLVTGGMVIFGALRGESLATTPGASAFLVAIDQDTANLKWSTLVETHQAAVIAGSPVLDGTTLYIGVSSQEEYSSLVSLLSPGKSYTCCSFRGSVVAVDVTTGKVLWKTYTIADSLYYSNDAGKLSGWAGDAIWSSTPVIDRKRNQLYVTTGNNYHNVPAEATAGASDGNYVDSVMALDMTTGAIKWARSFPEGGADVFTAQVATGQDSDFGAGANLFTATINGAPKDLVGAGQKSGMYWALDADTGATVWSIQVGSGGHLGGIHWGTATDGTRIYVEDNYGGDKPYAIAGTGPQAGMMAMTGTWAALDPSSGDILWQITDPAAAAPVNGVSCNGPVAVANGVLFAGSMDTLGTMFAFDAATGKMLWSYQSGGTVYGGPAIVGGVVYWGTGYPNGSGARPLGFGSTSMADGGVINSLYAFGLGLGSQDAGAPDAPSDDGGTPADATGE
ncbi:MAG: PQQ-binding-like beta-propeller repeat protein [Polyangiaceae bacterium]|jgi:polyvinyl alcohol dehydrogenase (cytochrome)